MRERTAHKSREARPALDRLTPAHRRAVAPALASGGRPLDAGPRAEMSARLGHDFSRVRIHTDARAADSASALDARAYAIGSDLVFGAGAFDPSGPEGAFLLAHELAHVAQNERFGPAVAAVSAQGDASEREASAAAATVLGGGRASVSAAPTATVARFGIGDVWDAVNPLSVVTNPLSGILHHGLAGEAAHEASEARTLQQAEASNDHDVDAVQHGIAGGARSLAGLAHGIPLLGGLADWGAGAVDQATQVPAGIMHGANGMAGGLMNMAVNPLGTARGLEQNAEHVSPLPGLIPNPLAMAHHALNAVTGQESVGSALNHSLNPSQVLEDDAQYMGGMVSHMADPYRQSIAEGRGGEVLGRGLFDIVSLFIGGGEARALGEGAEAVRGLEAGTGAVSATGGAVREGEALRAAEPTTIPVEPTTIPDLPGGVPDPYAPVIPPAPRVPHFPEPPPGGFPQAPPSPATAAASTGYAQRGADLVGAGRETMPSLPSSTGYAQRGSEIAAGRETIPPLSPAGAGPAGGTDIGGMIEHAMSDLSPAERSPGHAPLAPGDFAALPRPRTPPIPAYEPGGRIGPLDAAPPDPTREAAQYVHPADPAAQQHFMNRINADFPQEAEPASGLSAAGQREADAIARTRVRSY